MDRYTCGCQRPPAARRLLASTRERRREYTARRRVSGEGQTVNPDDDPPTRSPNVRLQMTAPYRVVKQRPRFQKEYDEAYAESERWIEQLLAEPA